MTITIIGPTSFRDSLAQTVHPIWRRIRPATQLERLLRDYPPYFVPYPGESEQLDAKQRRINLEYFLEKKDERLGHLTGLLGEFQLNPGPALDPEQDPRLFFEMLNEWAWNEWEKIPNIEKLTNWPDFESSKKNHSDTPLSMLFDVSILLGESVVLRHPKFHWALDNDRGSRQSQTTTWGRIVVFQPRDREKGYPWNSLDFEAATMFNCNIMAKHRFFRAAVSNDGIQAMAVAAIAGGYDPVW